MNAPVLLFACGNPARGDDALGPALLARIAALRGAHPEWPELELIEDYQLQVEHALDLSGRERVVFVDADCATSEPFTWQRIAPARSTGYTTHAMSPQALLQVYEAVVGRAPPPSFTLGIGGECFELGAPLSAAAAGNLEQAVAFATALLSRDDHGQWEATVRA